MSVDSESSVRKLLFRPPPIDCSSHVPVIGSIQRLDQGQAGGSGAVGVFPKTLQLRFS